MKFPFPFPSQYPTEKQAGFFESVFFLSLRRYHLFGPQVLTLAETAGRTVLKLSKFGAQGSQRRPRPADKWIGNKLPNTRDGPLILINGDVKRRLAPHDGVNSPAGVERENERERDHTARTPSQSKTFSPLPPQPISRAWLKTERPAPGIE